jgi:RNA polymerase sigma-70 factor (ECF subfamily)
LSREAPDQTLDKVVREASARIVGALVARFRDLDIAENAFADACLKAAELWPAEGSPRDPAAWLYRVADRRALDALRRRKSHERLAPPPPLPEPSPEDAMLDDATLIPDERLRLIFVCCHPAVAPDARAALTLRLVCGLSTEEIARAFLVTEPALAQRLVRAKRKIAEAGVSFEVPGPDAWPERIEAVLSTIEIAYAKAHEDAAGAGSHAGYAAEMIRLTGVLAELLPNDVEVLGLAALIRYAEARRPARLDETGAMTPLSEQDPARWIASLIEAGNAYFNRIDYHRPGPRALQAAIHGVWCARPSLADPPPWPTVLQLYDGLLRHRDDPIVRLNRAVALAEVEGVEAALAEVDALDAEALENFLSFHAVRADLLRRLGRVEEARAAYRRALDLAPADAERIWLERRVESLNG